jgi:(p)ppGpp synthase/HD superfamily hydrolase
VVKASVSHNRKIGNGMSTLEHAIALATNAHKGQQDKNGSPYILHPLRLMTRMGSAIDKIVAVLHDVVEDTPVTIRDLKEKGFSSDVLDAVDCLTRRKDETYDAFIERCKANPIAMRVKIADLEDNMDIRRFDTLRAEDLERLNKYLKAWRGLTGEM